MIIFQSAKEIQQTLLDLQKEGRTIGFVPTMGFLHEGHLSLIKNAKEMADVVVVSIFVNPTQFGPNEDFETYPRDIKRDQELLKQNDVDFLFIPTVDEIYPLGTSIISVQVNERVGELCGKTRLGHFDGVANVLTRLFNIIHPDYAYFGMKDAQQVAVVDGLIQSFHFPIKLVSVTTVREEDGLAKSSRNVRLKPEERHEAPYIYKALQQGFNALNNGVNNPDEIEQTIRTFMTEHIRLGDIDYIQVLSYPNLMNHTHISGKLIMAVAVKYSEARLIDNIVAIPAWSV